MIDNNKLLNEKILNKIENKLILLCMSSFAIWLIIYMIKSGIIEEFKLYPFNTIIFSALFITIVSVFFGLFIANILFQTILSPIILTKIHNFIFKGR